MRVKLIGSFIVTLLLFRPDFLIAQIRIGVSAPLSGNAATYGTDLRNAVEFANAELGGNRYQLIYEDDQCDPKTALSVAQKLVEKDRVNVVIGSACSGSTLSAARFLSRQKIILITPSASAAAIAKAGEYVYRTWPSDAKAAELLYQHMADRHQILGLLSEETEYAQGFLDGMRDSNANQKRVLVEESFIGTTADYRSLLLRLRAKKIEGLFINSQSEATFLAVVKQLAEMQWKIPLYSAYWAGSASFLANAGSLADDIVYVDGPVAADVLTEEGKKLLEVFVSRYGEPRFSRLIVATTIEAFRAVDLAITSGEDFRGFLNRKKFEGIFGPWHFDSDGEIVGLGFQMRVIKKGIATPL